MGVSMDSVSKQLLKIENNLIAEENEEQMLQQLTQLSREFTSQDISQVVPVNFHEATTQSINNMLNKYYQFLGERQSKLQEMQNYLNRLIQNVKLAKKYFDENKTTADQIISKLSRFQKTLSKNPKIRTKNSPKSTAFFRKKDLTQ